MSTTSQEKTINDITITIRQLPAMKATKFFRVLTGCFGPSMLKLTGEDESAGGGDLATAMESLMMELDEKMLQHIISTLFQDATVEIDGSVKNLNSAFDRVFQGKILTMFKFLYFALEVNYADFIEGFKGGDLQGLGLANL